MASLQAKLFNAIYEHIMETTGRPWLYVDAKHFPPALQAQYKGSLTIPLKVHYAALAGGVIDVTDAGINFTTRLGGVERTFNLLWSEFALSTESHDVDLLALSLFTSNDGDIIDAVKFKDLVESTQEPEPEQKPNKPGLKLVK